MGAAETVSIPEVEQKTTPKRQPRYNVILLDDNDHTYDYVIRMICELFGYSVEKAYKLACEVDASKRVIVLTTTFEHGELKQEQIHAYGTDPLISHCKGSMTAVLEPSIDA